MTNQVDITVAFNDIRRVQAEIKALKAQRDAIQSTIDDMVWGVFREYCKRQGIFFSHPERWTLEEDCISVDGRDGCRGCYDYMEISIPLEFFIDTDAAFVRMDEEAEQEAREEAEAAAQRQTERDRREYERLKGLFENTGGEE
jgi:hypothetical protein